MLCAVRKTDGVNVIATEEPKTNIVFTCPECNNEVILRKGTLRIAHFAHKPPITCIFGSGETEAHRRCKVEIYRALLENPAVRKAQLERPLKAVRPDVSAYIHNLPVAIEVQLSSLSLETIQRRTEEYTRRGIYILWLCQWTSELDAVRYSPRIWEKWLHAAYFGRIYFWTSGLTVIPYHLAEHYLPVPLTEWRGERGESMSAGGYIRLSKRYKTPVRGKPLHIVDDFIGSMRDEWNSKSLVVPQALLFIDKRRKFAVDDISNAP